MMGPAMSDIPKGYKQTELGVIPVDWDVDCLGRFWSVTDCKHVTATFIPSGYPVASIKEVQVRFVDLTNANQTNERFYRLLTEGLRQPRPGDLIMSRNATVGEIAQVADWHQAFAMGQDVCLLRKRSPDFSSDFLQSVFRSEIIGSQLSDLMVGSTFKRANVRQIKGLMIPMPGCSEQAAIAEALSDADAFIESLDDLLAKKRQLKQGAMQELLTGKKRLLGFSDEWELASAGDIGRFQSGSGFPIKFQGASAGEYPFFKVSDMNTEGNETFIETANNYISEALRKQLGAIAFPANSIVFAKVGAAVFLERKKILTKASCLDNNMAAFVLDTSRTDNRFIHYLLLNTKLSSLVSTTALPSLSGSVLSAIKFLLPSVAEQTAIAAILSDMDTEIAALEDKLAKARNLKQGMMQELLTGRIRLV
jgi:type I restriction enzyme S subunit